MSGTHVNCGNEGHPEEQLESFSVSTTLPVGEFVPGVFLTRTPKTPYASLPPPHTSQATAEKDNHRAQSMRNMGDNTV